METGERVDTSVTTATLNITGKQTLSSAVWQFGAGVEGGNGRFCTNGHDVGPGDDETESLVLGEVDGDSTLDLAVGNDGQNTVYLNLDHARYLPLMLQSTP